MYNELRKGMQPNFWVVSGRKIAWKASANSQGGNCHRKCPYLVILMPLSPSRYVGEDGPLLVLSPAPMQGRIQEYA